MKNSGNDPRVRWWEYGWYVMVMFLFLLVGIFLLIAGLITGKVGRLGRPASYAVTIVSLLAILGTWAAYQYYRPLNLADQRVAVIIKPGDSFGRVVDQLVSGGVVRSRLMLKWPARLRGIDRKLTTGRYTFSGHNSCQSVLERLTRGEIDRVKVTIPEGLPIWKTAALLARGLDLDSATVMGLNSDSSFLAAVDLPYLEGYLFPETYYFPWGVDERTVVTDMVGMFRTQTETIWIDAHILGLNLDEIVRLASIVEAETKVDSERAMVASVYCNRLRDKMRLDADPTVIYGLGGLERPLYQGDLRRETPYNTYIHKGLPPTPINSPGLAALRAAANPAPTEYYFFVADNRGGHRFSKTNAEHNRARREIQKESTPQP
ncbi:MAG: endolytic transglycosylase MltG [bacterium]